MYEIVFDDPLIGGDFYKTQSQDEGIYELVNLDINERSTVPTETDLISTPTTLSDVLSHPIRFRNGVNPKGGRIKIFVPLSAAEGKGPTVAVPPEHVFSGQATQLLRLAGTFRIVPVAGTTPKPKVRAIVRFFIDGQVGMKFLASLGTTAANLNCTLQVQGIGSVSGSGTASATTTVGFGGTVGLSKDVKPEPTAAVAPSVQTQSTSTGTFPIAQDLFGELPVNTAIPFSVIVTLRAQNVAVLLGCTASWAILSAASMTIVPLREDGDPCFSHSVFSFDAATGEVSVQHPLRVLEAITPPSHKALEGVPEDPPPTITFDNFVPQVETIFDGERLTDQDGLFGSNITYSGIVFQGTGDDGVHRFSDGQIKFLDPGDSSIRASGTLTNIAANPETDTFTATISEFTLNALTADQTPLGGALHQNGGVAVFDPELIAVTNGFTRDGLTTLPFSVVVGTEGVV